MTQDSTEWRQWGIRAAQQGDRANALLALQRAVAADPSDIAAWLWLAAVQPDPQQALAALEHVLALDPQQPQALAGVAAIHARLGTAAPPPAAPIPAARPAPVPEPAPALAPALDDLLQRGLLAARQGRWAEAQEALMAVVQQDEQNVAAWYALSTVLEDPAEVEIALENTLQLDPGHAAAAAALRRLRATPAPVPAPAPPPAPVSTIPPAAAAPAPPVASGGADSPGAVYTELIGQVLGGRYQVLATFPGLNTVLLLAHDGRSGNYVLLRPLVELGRAAKVPRGALVFQGQPFALSPIGLGGISLTTFMSAIGRMQPRQVIAYGRRLIQEAHRQPDRLLERRAWRPESITLTAEGALDLSTPGLAPGEVPVPTAWSPPEQRAAGPLDERSDVYLTGAFMHYLLVGQSPPDPAAAGPGSVLATPPAPLGPEVAAHPLTLEGVIRRALQPAPADRYPTLAALDSALMALIPLIEQAERAAGQPAALPPWWGRGYLGRDRVGWAIFGGLMLLILLAGLASIGLGPRLSPPRDLNGTPPPAAFTPTDPLADVFAAGGRASIDHLTIRRVDLQAPTPSVYFSVVSADAKPVGHLTAADFSLTGGEAAIPNLEISNLTETTATVGTYLVVQTGGAATSDQLAALQPAMSRLTFILGPTFPLGLVSYGDAPRLVQDLTITSTLVLSGLETLQPGGQTALYDALGRAVAAARQQPGPAGIILLSDGTDTASQELTAGTAMTLCRQSGIPVDVIGLAEAPGYQPAALQALAAGTGGEFLEAADTSAIVERYRRFAGLIRGQYRAQLPNPPVPASLTLTTQFGGRLFQQTWIAPAP